MTILGIDVGLKTLSLCLLSKQHIFKWGVYNVLNEELVCETCGRKAKYKEGFCGTHYKGEKIKKNEIKSKKVKSFSLQELAVKLIELLEDLLQDSIFESVELVVIELQPRFNPKMCFSSNVIFTKLCDFYKDKKVKIKFEKANRKLKNYSGNKGCFIENTYTNRKKRSVEYVSCELLNYNQDMQDFFKDQKKKDDASDSFLLAFNNL